ncbi:23S rRNA (guanosine(2251)-2'-O)-methyltransferase RlmB [Pseudactinotalea sp. HY158]|uniref:23S rRNA (guanosine(2251)-2'-O)-methyltransferase RlmB n=1 Tax=Pseudactinotalea sp. HY158 TaxID=2654547 RepID=UPI00129C5247|nr:23S rRNA (guanosine(2251)-2'-O)-methyltransferase RlmB [Pseudactinotalea sp. HY158]QGH68425.1 23S rRNA (guanosine(2251)-2'-O)-methyltransferase RlmB [Pseudactinotalea sp. HY158]
MAGNQQRPGGGGRPKKKGPSQGTGGHGRKRLEGKGPTPKAEDRVYHAAHRRKQAADRLVAKQQQQRRAPERRDRVEGVVTGRNSVLEALRAELPATTLFVASGLDSDERVAECLELAGAGGVPIRQVGRPDLDRIAGGVHQGIALEVPPYEYADPGDLLDESLRAGRTPLFIALDSVTDPHNLGAAMRSGAAFGADGVIVPARRSAGVNPTVWKVSAGAAARLPVARATNLVRTLQDFKRAGCFVVGLDAGGDTTLPEFHLAEEPLVLVLGSEGAGLGRLVRETCDVVVSIPIAARMESLNASVAMGITLYDVARRRERAAGGQAG